MLRLGRGRRKRAGQQYLGGCLLYLRYPCDD